MPCIVAFDVRPGLRFGKIVKSRLQSVVIIRSTSVQSFRIERIFRAVSIRDLLEGGSVLVEIGNGFAITEKLRFPIPLS